MLCIAYCESFAFWFFFASLRRRSAFAKSPLRSHFSCINDEKRERSGGKKTKRRSFHCTVKVSQFGILPHRSAAAPTPNSHHLHF